MSTTRPYDESGGVRAARLDRGGARRREGDLRRRWLWMDVRVVDEEEESSDEEDDE